MLLQFLLKPAADVRLFEVTSFILVRRASTSPVYMSLDNNIQMMPEGWLDTFIGAGRGGESIGLACRRDAGQNL